MNATLMDLLTAGSISAPVIYLWIISAVIGIMSVLNVIKMFSYISEGRLTNHSALEGGVLSPYFYVLSLLYTAAFYLPIVLFGLSYNFAKEHLSVLIPLCIANSLYWATSGANLVYLRYERYQPLTLIFFHGIFIACESVPLIFNSNGFPEFSLHQKYGIFYLVHILICIIIFVGAARGWKRIYPADSSFGAFVCRTSQIGKYMWPKGEYLVKFRLLTCFGLLFIGRLINMAVPLYSKWIVDDLSKSPPRFCYDLIIVGMALKSLQGGGAMGGFLNTLRSIQWLNVQQNTRLLVETDVFRHLHRLPLKWHLERKSGEVMKVIDRGTSSLNTFIQYLLFNIVPTLVDIFIAIIFFITMFDYLFGLLVGSTMFIYLSLTIVITRWRIRFRREMNAAENYMGAVAMDSLLNCETVKYYGNEDLEYRRYKAAIADFQSKERKALYSQQFLNGIQNTILGVSTTAGCVLMAYRITSPDSELSSGDYVMFLTYFQQLSVPLDFLGTVYAALQKSFINMENMFSLLAEPPEDANELSIVPINAEGSIELRNVNFAYIAERPILRGVSFSVPSGKTVALVGPSGSGKSTIIRLLFRLYDVGDGEILLDGVNIKDLQLKGLREKMGIVPQDTVLFNDTVEYNIRYGRPSASFEEIEDAAKDAEIHNFIVGHPKGYECVVGERGLKLSGGEKQRVAIARTILKRPNFILLDEATSSLDSRTERAIQSSLTKLCEHRTAVIVAHRLSTIVNADIIVVLNKGEIVETGSHAELLAENGLYAHMWNLQNEGNISTNNLEENGS